VPPLIGERFKHFDPDRNPFYEHAEVQLFRALRGRKTVGTIAAVADELHVQVWREPVGFFGEFEVIEDYQVAAALLSAARQWLASRGREIMRGPVNLNINDEVGLLIDGFDGRPVIMMTYNPPYYQTFMERYGLVKAKDLYAYIVDIASFGPNLENLPPRVSRVARIARERYGVQVRPLDFDRFEEEVELVKPIYRKAWSENWSALPMTDGEFTTLANNLRQIADPALVCLGFIDGEAIGCFVGIPDYNQVAYHLNGRLFPIGWAKFLWYRRKITGFRVLIMGVLEEHRLKGVESLFYEEVTRAAIRKGYQWVEMSWILEDNYKISRAIETLGGKIYRTYRIYDVPTS
jgi:GNAT superfamily N-acetyltransferase